MRITIETTNSEPLYSFEKTVESPYDEQTLEVIFQMFVELIEGMYPGAQKYLDQKQNRKLLKTIRKGNDGHNKI